MLKTLDLGYFIEKTYFDEDGAQNYLVFRVFRVLNYLEYFRLNSKLITKWKSKGLSNESLEAISTSDKTLTPSINYYGEKARLIFT